MPAQRLLVRKIREILRLRYEQGLSHREVAQACVIGPSSVSRYLQRAARHGLGWPLPADLDDAGLEARLFRRPAPAPNRARPDCAHIHGELKRNGVTLQLLWEEYLQVHPSGYRYTQFCEIYRQWARRLRPSMRQVHRAGEKTFIDFSGKRPTLVDRRTGELRPVELFVAVLGASSLTYAEATATQQLGDWVDAHVHMVEYFGGTTTLWVPDQLRSAITRPCRYEPEVNRTYADLAAHYGAVVIPARPRKPRDKALVETSVLVAQRWILARLRDQTFFELGPLNQAIRVLLDELNDRPLKKLGVSRRALYEQLDRPALRPLPTARYVLAHWKLCRVNIDYHVELERHVYSVPYQLVREQVEGPLHDAHRRDLPSRQARGLAPAALRPPGVHRGRAHAQRPPRTGRVDPVKAHPLGRESWTGDRSARPPASLRAVSTPSRAIAPAWGSCSWGDVTEAAASRRPAPVPWRSARLASSPSGTSSPAGQDRLPFEPPAETHPTPVHTNIRGGAYYAAATREED